MDIKDAGPDLQKESVERKIHLMCIIESIVFIGLMQLGKFVQSLPEDQYHKLIHLIDSIPSLQLDQNYFRWQMTDMLSTVALTLSGEFIVNVFADMFPKLDPGKTIRKSSRLIAGVCVLLLFLHLEQENVTKEGAVGFYSDEVSAMKDRINYIAGFILVMALPIIRMRFTRVHENKLLEKKEDRS